VARTKLQVSSPKSPVAKATGSPKDRGLPELDRLIHERMRLGIVSALAAQETLTFGELKGLLQSTDGNLSVHARKLEDAGYIACTKTFEDRVPRSAYRLTALGRRALEKYLGHLEAVIEHARGR